MGHLKGTPGDLTIIYLTANKISDFFGENCRKQLLKAADEMPIISVSLKPIDFGQNICIGDSEPSAWNIYYQVLLGAREAKTKYIGIAEDDVLYSWEHYHHWRPADDVIGYNMSKWGIYTWSEPPEFSFTRRKNNTSMIAPTKFIIEALEERFAKYPKGTPYPAQWWGEVGKYDTKLGLKRRTIKEFWTATPNIVFTHEDALGMKGLGKRKRMGMIRAYEIPYWGRAEDVVRLWSKS